jgi:hypothetical protein
MVALSEAVGRTFVMWRPLSGARVDAAAGELALSFLDAAGGVKVEVGLALGGLLSPRLNAGVEASVRLVTAPAGWQSKVEAAQSALAPALGAAGQSMGKVLDTVCDCVCGVLSAAEAGSPPPAAAAPQAAPGITLAA